MTTEVKTNDTYRAMVKYRRAVARIKRDILLDVPQSQDRDLFIANLEHATKHLHRAIRQPESD